MFKPVFLKQFRQFHFFKTLGYLYVALKIREIEYVCEKGSRAYLFQIALEIMWLRIQIMKW